MAELYPQAPSTPNEVAARLKILEERYANLSRREQITEQNLIAFEKDMRADIKAVQERLIETRRHVAEVKEHLDTLKGQVADSADKNELRVLEAYLNMIQPMQFVTRAELKKNG
jgi:hypothetical protein